MTTIPEKRYETRTHSSFSETLRAALEFGICIARTCVFVCIRHACGICAYYTLYLYACVRYDNLYTENVAAVTPVTYLVIAHLHI